MADNPLSRDIPDELSGVVQQGQLNMVLHGHGMAVLIGGEWRDWTSSLLKHAEEINARYDAWTAANGVLSQLRPHESAALSLALSDLHRDGELDPAVAKVCVLTLGRVCGLVGYDDERVVYSVDRPTLNTADCEITVEGVGDVRSE